MIAGLRTYPETRGSGVPWFGKIPKNWRIRRLRNVCDIRVSNVDKHSRDHEEPVRLCNYVDVYKNDHIRSGMAFMRATATKEEIARFRLQPGDVLVTKDSEAWTDIGVPALVRQSDDDIICGYHLALLRPSPEVLEGGYLFRLLQSQCVAYPFHVAAKGVTRYGLSHGAIKSVRLLLPPVVEQIGMVRFLDHVDRKISLYIRTKGKLIALLEEQKQATIHQAVTGQIDVRTSQPYSAYKDSGGEWLEKIPAHWEVTRLGKLITLTTGFPFKSEGFTQNARDVRLLRGVNVAPGRLRWREVVRWPAADVASYGEYLLETGDIALGMDRPVIRAGTRVALVSECDVPSLLLQRVARIRPSRRIRRDFALLLLRGKAFADYLAPIFTGISVPHLSPEQIRGFRLPLPSVGEQDEILEGLSLGIRAVEREKDRAKSQIELLREYCTRLSADVVTGKVDVREAAAQLPDADPLETDDALEDTPSTDQPADLDEPGIQRNELRS